MKTRFLYIGFLLMLQQLSFGQFELKTNDDVKWFNSLAQEKIFVHHNDNVIFSGEQLYYKVYCLNANSKKFSNNSKIAYVELVGKEGTIFRHKVTLDNGSGQSDYFVPATIPSGHYKLIAYTQWMKNGGKDHFFKSDITIINPYNRINFDDSAVASRPQSDMSSNASSQFLKVETDKQTYGQREEVSMSIMSLKGPTTYGVYSVSVNKVNDIPSKPQLNAIAYEHLFSDNKVSKKQSRNATIFLPEFKGDMFIGKVTKKESGQPAENVEVALSILSDEAHQDMVLTNSSGVFYFQLNKMSSQSLALFQVVGDNRSDYILEVNDHESPDYSSLKFDDFKIHSKYKDAIIERSVHNQIQNAFESVKNNQIVVPTYPEPFYGNYQQVTLLDDYKRFPTVAESLTEVVDNAWHERENGRQRYIKVREREK